MNSFSIQLHNIVKRHGETLAVDQISLNINQGEFFSILGPSGSGKTTLLRLIAGLEIPDEGKISIAGRSMNSIPAYQRPVNTVFQHFALFPHLTIWQNVAFGLEMQRLPVGDIQERVSQMLDLVRLQGKYHRLPSEVSGGEQQRVALARGLVTRPEVLLLDEPLGALDQQLRQDMQEELKGLQEQVGVTFIYVTHHQEEALSMSSRVAVLNQGRIAQVGTPQEIYDTPTSSFVASFVGLANQIAGEVTKVNPPTCHVTIPHCGPLHAHCSEGISLGQKVSVMVRPERLFLSRERIQGQYDNGVSVTIRQVTYSGDEILYRVELSSGDLWRVRLPIITQQHLPFHIGETLFVNWFSVDCILLPPNLEHV
jgi:ABC-type Fe3+/spermidine/putrescine transport system ATPase subunit